jgi:hypothetical protein
MLLLAFLAACEHGDPGGGLSNIVFGTLAGQPDFDEQSLKAPNLYTQADRKEPSRYNFPVCAAVAGNATVLPAVATPLPTTKLSNDSIGQCVYSVLDKLDTVYGDYESDIYLAANSTGLLADLSVLGLGAAATVSSSKTTKTIMAAIITAVTGAKTAIDTDLLYKNSITNLINTMRSNRNGQKATMIRRLAANPPTIGTNSVRPYGSLAEASYDLVEYFEAGTLVSAMISLQDTTATKSSACKREVKEAKTGASPVDPEQQGRSAAAAMVAPDGTTSAQAQIEAAIKATASSAKNQATCSD